MCIAGCAFEGTLSSSLISLDPLRLMYRPESRATLIICHHIVTPGDPDDLFQCCGAVSGEVLCMFSLLSCFSW